MNSSAKTTVVIATRNRVERLLQTLAKIEPLEEISRVIVADNGSTDGTATMVRRHFPSVDILAFHSNVGAFARTVAARSVTSPYIAFCDDDTWWLPGSIDTGTKVLDRHGRIGLLNACVKVGPGERIDDACNAMAAVHAPDGLPGAPILFFLAGASLMRRHAFVSCGGYEKRFFIGGEETLLSLDFHRRGWLMRYLPSMTVRHDPSPIERNDSSRRRLVFRNRLWVAWMRYERGSAWRTTVEAAVRARTDCNVRAAFLRALAGLPWAILNRRPIDAALQRRVDAVWSFDAG